MIEALYTPPKQENHFTLMKPPSQEGCAQKPFDHNSEPSLILLMYVQLVAIFRTSIHKIILECYTGSMLKHNRAILYLNRANAWREGTNVNH